MCLPVTNMDASKTQFFASQAGDFVFPKAGLGSERLIYDLTEYRNTDSSRDDGCTILWSRFVGALGYPLLAAAAAIEGVVRLAFALLTLIPASLYAICDGGEVLFSVAETSLSPLFGIDLILRCTVGFFKNFAVEQMDFESLAIGKCFY